MTAVDARTPTISEVPRGHRAASPKKALIGVVVAVVVGAVVVITAPGGGSGRCRAVAFHAPEPGVATPPVGGQEPVLDQIRNAFRPRHGNVVYCHDFADPTVLRVGDQYYAYSTNNAQGNIPVLYGAGVFDAQHVRDALPHLPAWSRPGTVWAPSVVAVAGRYVMYYVTGQRANGDLCISTALADRPTGPFIDRSTKPVLCNAIDPKPFIDSHGNAYLLWGADGTIYGARLSADLRTLLGTPVALIHAEQPWESGVVEAPTMVQHHSRALLFFSANHWDTAGYAIGYATCSTPLGPCQQTPGPWLASQGQVRGPGGQDFFTDTHGQLWMVFHAWIGTVGYPHGARSLFVVPVTITHNQPTTTPAP